MKFLRCISLTFLSLFYFQFARAQVADSLLQMKFSHLNVGLDYRFCEGKYDRGPNSANFQNFKTSLYGFSLQYQTSFLGNYLLKNNKKIKLGDLLSSSLGLGIYNSKHPEIDIPLATYYNFEFGFGAIWSIHKQHEIGLNLMILKFARDRVSPNRSGSMMMLRYRYSKYTLSVGVEARRDRIFGWLQVFQTALLVPLQYHFQLEYAMLKTKKVGLRIEVLKDAQTTYFQNNIIPQFNINSQLYYGVSF